MGPDCSPVRPAQDIRRTTLQWRPMPGAWDRRSAAEQARQQNTLLRQTVMQLALGHVPFVRSVMRSIGMDARTFRGFEDLYRVPLSLRGDVFDPRLNPEGPQ